MMRESFLKKVRRVLAEQGQQDLSQQSSFVNLFQLKQNHRCLICMHIFKRRADLEHKLFDLFAVFWVARLHLQRGMCLVYGHRGYISREVCASPMAIEATSPKRYVPHLWP